ncbi:hypothetical protein EXIGLDRAFT_773725 [Exidia glandulosa HHB12029]|uniref:Uncharacterized protein n=1 Tax=Exidia glandulosa HHB12029 TaxID=1314781 RepID=A0A165ENA3_EXIGL|nr:hypothetical protein EXIGLDRAFT_773725 [Exidia glandulosa HHB12029]
MKIQALLFFSSLALFAVALDPAHVTQADVDEAQAQKDDLCTGDSWNATMKELRGYFEDQKAAMKAGNDPSDDGAAEEEQDDPAHDDAVFKQWVENQTSYHSAVAECEEADMHLGAVQYTFDEQNKPQDDKNTTESDVPAPETAEATATSTKPQTEKPEDASAKPSQSDPSSASSVEMAGGLLVATLTLAVWLS